MRTIYEKTTGSLIKTADRSITSFPSGLIRVDQVYVGKSDEESTHRAALSYGAAMPNQNDTPAIDGLHIFPEVQESRDGSGLTKYQCSGYGRTTDQYRELSRSQNIVNTVSNGQIRSNLRITLKTMDAVIVKRNGELFGSGLVDFSNSFLQIIDVQVLGSPLSSMLSVYEVLLDSSRIPNIRTYAALFDFGDGGGFTAVEFSISDPYLTATSRRNYGEFVEYEFTAVRQPLYNLETTTA
jgi:hypothetical protein